MNGARYCVGYPSGRMAEQDNAGMERFLNAVLGGMDQDEYEDMIARNAERRKAQKDAALKSARAMLRQANRPVRRRDMLSAMEDAVMRQVSNFERMSTVPQAVSLIATVICLNMLKDGPLHEEG